MQICPRRASTAWTAEERAKWLPRLKANPNALRRDRRSRRRFPTCSLIDTFPVDFLRLLLRFSFRRNGSAGRISFSASARGRAGSSGTFGNRPARCRQSRRRHFPHVEAEPEHVHVVLTGRSCFDASHRNLGNGLRKLSHLNLPPRARQQPRDENQTVGSPFAVVRRQPAGGDDLRRAIVRGRARGIAQHLDLDPGSPALRGPARAAMATTRGMIVRSRPLGVFDSAPAKLRLIAVTPTNSSYNSAIGMKRSASDALSHADRSSSCGS